ncbi:MAG: hypothetical protein AAF146_11205 [Bacteroidota bacterium]
MKNSKLLTNSWVITLSATLIGVFAAMYLNEWMASRKLTRQKSIATQNILAEFQANRDFLEGTLEDHQELLEIMDFLGRYVNEEEDLIAPSVAFNAFQVKFPDLIRVADSTYVAEGIYRYDGEVNLDISFPHFELTTITWDALKSSGLIATFPYECLLHLETISNITDEVSNRNKELLDYFTGARDSGANNRNLISHLELLIEYESALINQYDSSEEELDECT